MRNAFAIIALDERVGIDEVVKCYGRLALQFNVSLYNNSIRKLKVVGIF